MAEKEAPEPSIQDDLTAAIAEARSRQDELRDFVTKDDPKPAKEAEPVTEEVTEEAQTEQAETAEAEAEPEPSEGPSWLPKEDREVFAEAPENVREAWERNFKGLQANYTRATQQLKEKGETLTRFEQVIAPYRPMIANSGATPEQAIQYLFGWYQRLVSDPKGTLPQLAQSVGISLNNTVSEQEQFNSGLDDPRIKALEQRLGAVQSTLIAQQRIQTQTAQERITQEIHEFATAKGADGKPTHPHFERVKDSMVPFVQAGRSMKDAYDIAVRADPELFEKLVAERSRAALNKPPVKKVTSKPKASGSGISVPKSFDSMTLDEELAERLKLARRAS